MTKQERAHYILNTLDELFPDVAVPLQHSDPYTLLIAVLLSAQCTDERVNRVTPKLFLVASRPEEMANLDVAVIEDIIRPCGLSARKALAIQKLSFIILNEFNGEVPENQEALERLPGVGHKTASVVMSQAFGHPAFPVDTHIHRLAKRWKLSNGLNVVKTEKDLKKLFPMDRWNDLHLKIIYYGRQFCPARGHQLERCIICKHLLENTIKKDNPARGES